MKIMEIDECIKFIENAITSGNKSVIANIEFGKLLIEVNNQDYGPETTVIVEDWSFAPPTHINMINMDNKADYYVCIANPSSPLTLHLRIVEAIYRVMFRSMLGVTIDGDIADAAVMIHRHEHEGKTLTTNKLYHDFCEHNLNILVRKNDMVQWLVRDHFDRRLKTAKSIIAKACKIFDDEYTTGYYADVISMDKYSRKIFGLILYVADLNNINIHSRIMFSQTKTVHIVDVG